MLIEIVSVGEVTLREPDDFKRFAVILSGAAVSADRIEILRGLGEVSDAEHVYVDPALIISLAGDRANDPQWRESLNGMIGYAAGHGWVNQAGFVRAHVELA